MVQLETVEDFEKAYAYLNNHRPEISYILYSVRQFGFCPVCNAVTEYELLETFEKKCLKCSRVFWGYLRKPYDLLQYLLLGDYPLPKESADKIRKLYSREQQKIFFQELLERFIQEQKSTQRKAGNNIRRAAKLRDAKNTRWALDNLS